MKLNKIILTLALLAFPVFSWGSTISLEPRGNLPSFGETAIFDVYLDTEGQTINTVEGLIKIDDQDKLFFQNYFVANSVLSLWLNKPTFNSEDRTVSFIGGVPGGVKTSHGLLFSLVFSVKEEGSLSFKLQKSIVYNNDGQGVATIAKGKDLVFVIPAKGESGLKNNWEELLKQDKTPPRPFTVYLNQDSDLFNGQKFISFVTSDNETGVDYYEIREGKFPPEKAENQYVLQSQTKTEKVEVIAYDRAGNKRSATLSGEDSSQFAKVLWLVLILAVVRLLWMIWRRLRVKKY